MTKAKGFERKYAQILGYFPSWDFGQTLKPEAKHGNPGST
jgi:hypothetical protein